MRTGFAFSRIPIQLNIQLIYVDMNAVCGWDAGEAIPGQKLREITANRCESRAAAIFLRYLRWFCFTGPGDETFPQLDTNAAESGFGWFRARRAQMHGNAAEFKRTWMEMQHNTNEAEHKSAGTKFS